MIFKISVRGLVEFMLRSGSLELAGGRSDEASMAEGARIHRSLQKKEGAGYQAEVPLRIDLPVLASDPDLSVLRLAETTGADEETVTPEEGDGNQEESIDPEGTGGNQEKTAAAEESVAPEENGGNGYTTVLVRLEGRADGIYLRKDEESSQGETNPSKKDSSKKDSLKIDSSTEVLSKTGSSKTRPSNEDPAEDGLSEENPQKKEAGIWTIDEIKTIRGALKPERPEEVHLAQARCYGRIYAEQQGLERIGIRMTYCSRLTGQVWYFYEEWTYEDLDSWFGDLIRSWLPWLGLRLSCRRTAIRTLREMQFPYVYRKGQFDLAAGVYRTIVHGRKLFLQAPTGTGKTLAVLFPSLKALGEGKAERIFYLTAKAVAGRAATEALTLLKERGLNIRSLVISSRDRICPLETVECTPAHCPRADGHYDRVNDALEDLLRRAGEGDVMTAERISECARDHGVCPYELARDAVDFADVIICDYNYIFHPEAAFTTPFDRSLLLIDEAHNLLDRARDMYSASLASREVRTFRRSVRDRQPGLWKSMRGLVRVLGRLEKEAAGDGRGDGQVLAGEDRPERALVLEGWTEEKITKESGTKEIGTQVTSTGEAGTKETGVKEAGTRVTSTGEASTGEAGTEETGAGVISAEETGAAGTPAKEELLSALRETGDAIRWILEQDSKSRALQSAAGIETEGPGRDLLDFYFGISHFQKMLEEIDSHYIVYSTGGGRRRGGRGFELHLFCADPSGRVGSRMASYISTVLFSATFLPIQYYKGLLGGGPEDYEMYAPSSFPPERRKILIVKDVTSRYRDRSADNYERIAGAIGQAAACHPGNYMAFFPSYLFLENVLEAFRGLYGTSDQAPAGISVLAQKPQMTDRERADFLQAFEEARTDRTLVGFCVMGGMFGEGIDLRDDRLIGTFVVGTGIPPVDPGRELLKRYFSDRGRAGYDFAYRFPGMNKVLQAAGRVIRTSTDTGVILLLDGRFGEAVNRGLFPAEWGDPPAVDSGTAARLVGEFWDRQKC
ncbi:MAG: ATP-dependent DNA helicase [Sarcina sp.]|nr:ATP-dependent DNA helicase [Sarcina sp.]